MEQALHYTIQPDYTVEVMRQEGRQRTATKIISADTFLECLCQSVETDFFCSELLPRGCIHYAEGADNRYVSLLYDQGYAAMSVVNKKRKKVQNYRRFPVPWMVYRFTVTESGRIERVSIAVVEKGRLHAASKLYYYPFGNIYADRSACMGNNPLPVIQTLSQLAELPDYITSLPHNGDIYRYSYNQQGLGQMELFQYMRGKTADDYYSDILVEIPNETLGTFLHLK